MSNKIRNIIIILLVIILIALAVWYFMATKSDKKQPPAEELTVKTDQQVKKDKTENKIVDNLEKKVAGKSKEKISLENKILNNARFFIERYGSFSNQAEWQNLKDLKSFVTDDLYQDFENIMSRAQTGEEYYSLNTKVLSIKISNFTDGEALVVANTQKQEDNNGKESIFYQKVEVKLIPVNNNWLISDVKIDSKKESK